MLLYHGTKIEYKESILNDGIFAYESDKVSNDDRLNEVAIYGFSAWEDAMDFATDNYGGDFEIVSFETGECDVVEDPEYKDASLYGKAYAVVGVSAIECSHYIDSEEYYNN